MPAAGLFAALSEALGKANQNPALGGAFSTYQIKRAAARHRRRSRQGQARERRLSDVFQTLQVYSARSTSTTSTFRRTYQVVAQADAPFRGQLDDVMPLKTRNAAGEMVPWLGHQRVALLRPRCGAALQRLHLGRHQRRAGAGFSRGKRRRRWPRSSITRCARHVVRVDDLAYQQLISGNTDCWCSRYACCSCFLVLAAQYESLSLPSRSS